MGKRMKKKTARKSKHRADKEPECNYQEAGEQAEEELFKVEKILDRKLGRNGVELYRIRWKGYNASADSWEPPENVASTGHIDRYERQQRQRALKKNNAGVAVIEYEDGEREMVDMKIEKIEKFRGHKNPIANEEKKSDDGWVDGDDDVNDFSLIAEGEWIEILWRHANIYFPCKIISWTPLENERSHEKVKSGPSRKAVFAHLEESSVAVAVPKRKDVLCKHKGRKRIIKKSKQGNNVISRGERKSESGLDTSAKTFEREREQDTRPKPAQNTAPKFVEVEETQQMFWSGKIEPMHEATLQEEDRNHLDDHSIRIESIGINHDVGHLGNPVDTASLLKQKEDVLYKDKGIKRNIIKSKQGDNMISRGKRKRKSGLDISAKNSQLEPAQNSEPKLAVMEPTQQMISSGKIKPPHEATLQEKDRNGLDDHSISSASFGINDDVGHLGCPVETVGLPKQKDVLCKGKGTKKDIKQPKQGDYIASPGKSTSPKNSQLEPAQDTKPKPAQNLATTLAVTEPTQQMVSSGKSEAMHEVTLQEKGQNDLDDHSISSESFGINDVGHLGGPVERVGLPTPEDVLCKDKSMKRNIKKSKQGDDITSQGKRKRESGLDISAKNSQLERAQDTQPKPAQNTAPKLAVMEATEQIFSSGKREPQHEVTLQVKDQNDLDDHSISSASFGINDDVDHVGSPVETVGLSKQVVLGKDKGIKRNMKKSKQGDNVTNRGKRKRESGLGTSAKNSQLEPAQDTQLNPVQNSVLKLAVMEATQQMFSRGESEPLHEVTLQEKDRNDLDDHSISSESFGIDDDVNHLGSPVETVGERKNKGSGGSKKEEEEEKQVDEQTAARNQESRAKNEVEKMRGLPRLIHKPNVQNGALPGKVPCLESKATHHYGCEHNPMGMPSALSQTAQALPANIPNSDGLAAYFIDREHHPMGLPSTLPQMAQALPTNIPSSGSMAGYPMVLSSALSYSGQAFPVNISSFGNGVAYPQALPANVPSLIKAAYPYCCDCDPIMLSNALPQTTQALPVNISSLVSEVGYLQALPANVPRLESKASYPNGCEHHPIVLPSALPQTTQALPAKNSTSGGAPPASLESKAAYLYGREHNPNGMLSALPQTAQDLPAKTLIPENKTAHLIDCEHHQVGMPSGLPQMAQATNNITTVLNNINDLNEQECKVIQRKLALDPFLSSGQVIPPAQSGSSDPNNVVQLGSSLISGGVHYLSTSVANQKQNSCEDKREIRELSAGGASDGGTRLVTMPQGEEKGFADLFADYYLSNQLSETREEG